jgi:hypothetical protein
MEPLPAPQPSNLPPIIGTNEPKLADVVSQARPFRMPGAAAPNNVGAEPQVGQIFSREPASQAQVTPSQTMNQAASGDSDDKELQLALEKLAAKTEPSARGAAAQKVQEDESSNNALQSALGVLTGDAQASDEVSSGPGLNNPLQRAFVSLGRDENEQVNALRKLFGKSGGGARIKDGKVLFRRTKSEKYQPVEGDRGLMEFLGDIADLSGGVAEGAVATAVGAPVAAALAPASPFTSPLPAVAGGIAAGSLAGTSARKMLVDAVGISDDEFPEVSNAALQVGVDLALPAVLKGVGGGYSSLKKMWKEADPVNRFAQMRDVIHGVENVLQESGYAKVLGKRPTGEALADGIEAAQKKLAENVSLVDKAAIQRAGDKRFPVDNFLGKMKELLEPYAKFNEKTGLFEPVAKSKGVSSSTVGSLAGEDGGQMALSDVAGSIGEKEAYKNLAEGAGAQAAFGDPKGKMLLSDMVSDFNAFAAQSRAHGGATMQELLDRTRKYQGSADWDVKSTGGNQALQDAAGAALLDRNKAFTQALDGTPEAKIWERAYSNYAKEAVPIKTLDWMMKSQKAGDLIVDSVLAKKDAAMIENLRNYVGPNSEGWKSFKGNTIKKLIDDSMDSSGAFNGAKFNDTIKSYGKDFWKSFGEEESLNRLRLLARSAERIDLTGTLDPSKKTKLVEVLKGVVGFGGSKIPTVIALNQLVNGDKYAVDYLTNEGFMQVARGAKSEAEKRSIMAMAEVADRVRDASQVVKIKGRDVYVPVARKAAGALAFGKAVQRGGMEILNNQAEDDLPNIQPGSDVDTGEGSFSPPGE